jgi:DNA-binding XRE family transcriptional regulator
MVVRNMTLDGREYVVIPRRKWKAMERAAAGGVSATAADGTYGIEDVRASLAHKVAIKRKAAKLTQAELAKLSGVRVETISRLENGLHMPSVRTFDKIDRALNRRAMGERAPGV